MHKLLITLAAALCISTPINATPYSYKEAGMPADIPMSSRLKRLFADTKVVCFGRYAMTVPQEAEVLWGPVSFPSKIKIYQGGMAAIQKVRDEDIAAIQRKSDTAEFTFSAAGPVPDSWQIRYYQSENAKSVNLLFFKTYLNKGDLSFVMGDAIGDHETTPHAAIERQTTFAQNIRLRDPDEVPQEPGFCIDHGFIADNSYADQEMISAGIYLPSFPDITFSVSSNKDAYADYSAADMKSEIFGLLERIKQAKAQGGSAYPKVKKLRSGQRVVNNWHGEESLVVRPDGVHDFEWALVGKPKDVANPSEFNMQLFSKVADNLVGAANKTVLSDDEIVALWDKLLGGFKFRVQVPGSPAGSFYIEPDSVAKRLRESSAVCKPGDACPKTGYWKSYLPEHRARAAMNNAGKPVLFREGQVFHHWGMDDERAHMSWAWVAENPPPGVRWMIPYGM